MPASDPRKAGRTGGHHVRQSHPQAAARCDRGARHSDIDRRGIRGGSGEHRAELEPHRSDAPAGKQVLAGLEIWRDDINAKGGLLGRPVKLVYYDDQANPANAPGIYAKLMSIDKVDLLIGPYSTNVIAAALPAIIQANRTTIGIFGSAPTTR
jgi:hypothetical protein